MSQKSHKPRIVFAVLLFICLFIFSPSPDVAYASNGEAQLRIVAQYAIESITIIGANQNNDVVTCNTFANLG